MKPTYIYEYVIYLYNGDSLLYEVGAEIEERAKDLNITVENYILTLKLLSRALLT